MIFHKGRTGGASLVIFTRKAAFSMCVSEKIRKSIDIPMESW